MEVMVMVIDWNGFCSMSNVDAGVYVFSLLRKEVYALAVKANVYGHLIQDMSLDILRECLLRKRAYVVDPPKSLPWGVVCG